MTLRAAVVAALLAGCARPAVPPPMAEATARRPFEPVLDGQWIGAGICYGPHRDGQRPGGPGPSRDELREDLRLLAPRWNLLRIYGSDPPADDLLALIHDEHLPFRVMVGVWIAPDAPAANQQQVDDAVRLAERWPDEVLAIVVGNETQVTWSDHRVDPAVLIGHLRDARARTTEPVATADDFSFWLSPESDAIAREVDLIVLHAYAMWNGKPLDEALAFTQAQHAAVVARHPGVPVLLGEAGWATQRHSEGEQARLIKGEPGEAQQQVFFEAFSAWSREAKVPSTYFEAFDENWKGGPHPDEVEKHWGLFRADRTPKLAVTPR